MKITTSPYSHNPHCCQWLIWEAGVTGLAGVSIEHSDYALNVNLPSELRKHKVALTPNINLKSNSRPVDIQQLLV